MLINHAELIIDINSIPSDVMSDSTKALVRAYIVSQKPISAIPVDFIADKINSLEYLQKKMAHWTKTEMEVQMKTLSDLIYDYAQIARWKNVYEWAERTEE